MTHATLNASIAEAQRFLERAKCLRGALTWDKIRTKTEAYMSDHPKETASVRRASMDLTCILADLRAGR